MKMPTVMTRMMIYSLAEGLGITGRVSIGANCPTTLTHMHSAGVESPEYQHEYLDK